jgi:hypothetical protein
MPQRRMIGGRMVTIRDANTEAVVETIRPKASRAPKEAIRRLRIIQARLEALSDSTSLDSGPESNPTGNGTNSEASQQHLGGRQIVTSVPLEHRQAVSPYVTTWVLAELEQILPWLEGGDRPIWWDPTP